MIPTSHMTEVIRVERELDLRHWQLTHLATSAPRSGSLPYLRAWVGRIARPRPNTLPLPGNAAGAASCC